MQFTMGSDELIEVWNVADANQIQNMVYKQ